MEIHKELEKLINEKYVEKLALKRYRFVPDDKRGLVTCEDLVSAGYEGLLEAAQKYKQGKATKLATYAYHWIDGNMIREIIFYIGKDALLLDEEELNRARSGRGDANTDSSEDIGFSSIPPEEQVRIIRGKLKEFGLTEDEMHVYLATNGVGRDKVTNLGFLARELKKRESAIRVLKQRAEEKVKNGR